MSRDPEPLKRILRRFLQQMLTEAMPEYWERRAKTFAEVGTEECDQIALACRNHADLIRRYGPDPDVLAVVDDVLVDLGKAA